MFVRPSPEWQRGYSAAVTDFLLMLSTDYYRIRDKRKAEQIRKGISKLGGFHGTPDGVCPQEDSD
jgi:hypothetical protein